MPGFSGVLAQFCGSPLPQLISVDVLSLRVYFIQRIASLTAESVAAQWCAAYIALDSYYRDVSRCVPLSQPLPSNENVPKGSKQHVAEPQESKPNREPVYLHVDAYAEALYIGVFHEENLMLYVYRGSDMQMTFAFNVVGFKSGETSAAFHECRNCAGTGIGTRFLSVLGSCTLIRASPNDLGLVLEGFQQKCSNKSESSSPFWSGCLLG